MKKLIFNILLLLAFFPAVSFATDELWLKDIPLSRLQEVYRRCGYEGERGYLMLPSYKYPPIYLKNFPADYNSLTDETERNALFIKILAPLALKLNQDLLEERAVISAIAERFRQNQSLSAADIETLEAKAAKYDIFSRLKEDERWRYLISELLNRVDRIPPSIMITAAALETNWGTSRIVKEGNSLYKTLVWHTDKGLKPIGETTDDSYRIKIYPDIYASMHDFALKVNSHPSFTALRNFRREQRERTANISGLILAPYTYGNSVLKNYAGIFDYTMAYYELQVIDKSSLDATMIPEDITREFGRYVTKM